MPAALAFVDPTRPGYSICSQPYPSSFRREHPGEVLLALRRTTDGAPVARRNTCLSTHCAIPDMRYAKNRATPGPNPTTAVAITRTFFWFRANHATQQSDMGNAMIDIYDAIGIVGVAAFVIVLAILVVALFTKPDDLLL